MPLIDLTGQKFTRLTVIGRANPEQCTDKTTQAKWICQCDCGNPEPIIVLGSNLRRSHTKSCGCLQREKASERLHDLTGKQFGQLTVLARAANLYETQTAWLCQCACGQQSIVYGQSLIKGYTTSCGCQRGKSKQVENIINLLNSHNIPFTTEYLVRPTTQERYYFDFYINNSYFLEYDGEQHFSYKTCSGWNTLENTTMIVKRDLKKNDYCFANNISLIRIPYMHKNIEINDLLLDMSQFLITPFNEKLYYLPHNKIKALYVTERGIEEDE